MEIKLQVPEWAGGADSRGNRWYAERVDKYPNWQEGAYLVDDLSDCDDCYAWDDHEVWYCPKAFPKGVLYYHGSGCSCNSPHDFDENEESFTQCSTYEEFLSVFDSCLSTYRDYGRASADDILSFKGAIRRFFRELELDNIRCL